MGHLLRRLSGQIVVEGNSGCLSEFVVDILSSIILDDTVPHENDVHRECGRSPDKPMNLLVRATKHPPSMVG